jgi:DNA polymerase-3 subunit delta
MAPLKLEAAHRALNAGDLVPVYYVTGDDDILKEEFVDALVSAAVDPAARDFNVDVRSAGDLDGESLHALVETPPMLADRRAVVVKGLEQWRANAAVWKILARYLQHPSPSTVLVMVHGPGEKPNPDLAAAARHVHADSLTPGQAEEWAVTRARKAGIVLDPEAAAHLVSAVGAELAHIAMEIDKLAAASAPEQTVTVDDVARMVGIRSGETQRDWVWAALARDAAESVRLLDIVLPQPGVNGVRLVMALGTALVGTRFARSLRDDGASTAAAEDTIFRHLQSTRPPGLGNWREESRRWARAADKWPAPELDEALRALYQADRALKSSVVSDEVGVLSSFLLQIAVKKQVAA